jgi:hypothetical protein
VPNELKWLFWDCDPDSLDMDRHSDFITRRILVSGDWSAIQWLRGSIGDAGLRDWFLAGHGAALDPRRLRFWELILDLPKPMVDAWVAEARRSEWYRRAALE